MMFESTTVTSAPAPAKSDKMHMGDPAELDAKADHKQGVDVPTVLGPATGYGTNMRRTEPRDWHGTRDGRGCDGKPVGGRCPKCGANFTPPKDEPKMIELDPNQKRAMSREQQRTEIAREIHAKFLIKHKIASITNPEHVKAYDEECRKVYAASGL